MAVIPYTKQTWTDGSGGATPLSAARLAVLEAGVDEISRAPAVRVYHNANQSITTATLTALAFNSERIDQVAGAASTMHDTVTNNSRLTCRYAGVYQISASVSFASNATGYRLVRLRHQGTTYIASQIANAVTGTPTELSVSTPYSLAVNEYVEVVVYQTSGAGLNVESSANYSPEFSMVRVA